MKFVTRRGWEPFNGSQCIVVDGRRTVLEFRAEQSARVYVADDEDFVGEVLAGIGEGDLEVEVVGYGPLYVRVASDGRVWLRETERVQRTEAVFGTVFTEPVPARQLSPEFRHIQGLLKAAELERRRERETHDRELAEIRRRLASREVVDGRVPAASAGASADGLAGDAAQARGADVERGRESAVEREGVPRKGRQAAGAAGSDVGADSVGRTGDAVGVETVDTSHGRGGS